LQLFVRLDHTRSGDALCSVGLAIMRCLVRYNDSTFHTANVDGEGLVVSPTFLLSVSAWTVGIGRPSASPI
jgi:hypothetical protein